jgi:hypothetical protein
MTSRAVFIGRASPCRPHRTVPLDAAGPLRWGGARSQPIRAAAECAARARAIPPQEVVTPDRVRVAKQDDMMLAVGALVGEAKARSLHTRGYLGRLLRVLVCVGGDDAR